MIGHRFNEEQIVQILQQVKTGQLTISSVCLRCGITEDTFNRWLYTYGDANLPSRRLDQLEQENIRLKQLLVDRGHELNSVKELLARFM